MAAISKRLRVYLEDVETGQVQEVTGLLDTLTLEQRLGGPITLELRLVCLNPLTGLAGDFLKKRRREAEWLCDFCKTPNPRQHRLCDRCGAARSFTYEEEE